MDKTLVFGASLNPDRYGNRVIHRLVEKGVPTVAFGRKEGVVAGVPVRTDPAGFTEVETITLYLGPDNQPPYYETILDLGPKRVIFNPGTENPDFAERLERNGIEAVQACTLVLLATGQYDR